MAISICSSINAQKKALEKERGKFGRVPAWTMLFISLCTGALGYFVFWRRYYGFDQGLSGAGLVTTMVKHGLAVNLSLNGG